MPGGVGMSAIEYVPFHDARKWEREGLRTRDGHVYAHLLRRARGGGLVVLDRPTGLAEWLRLRGCWTPPGRTLYRRVGLRATQGEAHAVVLDVLLSSLGSRRGSFHRWIIEAYGCSSYTRGIDEMVRAVSGGPGDTLWICHPFAAKLTKRAATQRVVVDLFDDFTAHPDMSPPVQKELRESYRALCERAEKVAVNSVHLQEFLWGLTRREALLVPNGVDPEAFAGAEPMALPRLERPVVGYAGKMGRKIDTELLTVLAEALSRGTIVLAGPILDRGWMRPLLRHPRVHHVGDVPYVDLPRFLAATDVCIVPQRVGAGDVKGDPTKIYEYMASGRPVVATPIEGIGKFRGRIAIEATPAGFVGATLAAARGEPVPMGWIGADETWAARTAALCEYFGVSAKA